MLKYHEMVNHLEHLEEFKELLAPGNYHISEAGRLLLEETVLVLLVAASSSGRNTMLEHLIQTGDYYNIISDTTRDAQVRNGKLEQNGREYWFRHEDDVLADLKAGNFVEAAIIHNQQVSGISLREIEKAHKHGKIAITDIEINGVESIMNAKPDSTPIFVLPGSFDLWQSWMFTRGEMSPTEYTRRMRSAEREFMAAQERPYFQFVINDSSIEKAAEQVDQIAHGMPSQVDRNQAIPILEELLAGTRNWLLKYGTE